MTVSQAELRNALSSARKILEDIERRLDAGDTPPAMDPYVRRRMMLMRIKWSDNDVNRNELNELLAAYGTNYAWIGQQVKKGYLRVKQTPLGPRYSVTAKAVKEQQLDDDDEEEIAAWAAASEEVFAEDWGSKEDSIYDSL